MKAIILAGESKDDIEAFGKGKALINFKNIPLIEYTINALRNSEVIDYILVVGNKELLSPIIGNKVDKIVDQEKEMLDNLLKGMSYFNDDKIIVSTCDIPLITSDAINDFIAISKCLEVDVCYPIIKKESYENKYPDVKRTYASLQEGRFTGGNLIMLNPDKIKGIEKNIRYLIEHRKNPIKMAKTLGPTIILKMLSNKLTIEKLEYYINEKFYIKCKAVSTSYPEIGTDIDHIEDINILEKYT